MSAKAQTEGVTFTSALFHRWLPTVALIVGALFTLASLFSRVAVVEKRSESDHETIQRMDRRLLKHVCRTHPEDCEKE